MTQVIGKLDLEHTIREKAKKFFINEQKRLASLENSSRRV